MFSFLCTIYQVAPSFLDFVFPFGMGEEAQDFYFSGLKGEYRLASYDKTCVLPMLDRSGRDLRFSYNLRSVEPTSRRAAEPWSIRQCAVYHTFDVENGKMIWIIVKGNKEIQRRVTEVAERSTQSGNPFKCRGDVFATSLETHLLLCSWSGENWGWYIKDLENQLSSWQRGMLTYELERQPSPLSSPTLPKITSPRFSVGPFNLSRAHTLRPLLTAHTWTRSNTPQRPQTHTRFSTGSRSLEEPILVHSALSRAKGWRSAANNIRGFLAQPTRFDTGDNSGEEEFQSSPEIMVSPTFRSASSDGDLDDKSDKYTFRDLQRLQHIEEKVQEIVLVLKLNTKVLEQLRLHYDEATKHAEFPQEVKDKCRVRLHQFDKSIIGTEKDMEMLQLRTETLLHVLANRKKLVSVHVPCFYANVN